MAHWLFKSEPDSYSIADLAREKTTLWTGVRNYQARNLLRDAIKPGDHVLFYHSSTKPPAIVGLAKVVRGRIPDPTDREADPAHPTWYAVEIAHVKTLPRPIALDELRKTKALADMLLLQRGSRLSVQPVTPAQFQTLEKMFR